MNRYVAFVRAINVGGHAIVRMYDLQDAFLAAGCTDVRTYFHAGNIVFESPERDTAAVFERVRHRLRRLTGDEPVILFRTVREVERMVRGAPFKAFEAERGLKLYVAFLSQKPSGKPRVPRRSAPEQLEAIAMKNREVFIVSRRKKNGFYGFPNNFIEKELGVSATTRNWSTLSKIVEFVRNDPDR
jgi:uncharacterized protein (DUF1697 family)